MMKSIYKITFLLFFIPLIVIANNNKRKHEKRKTIKKEFTVNSDAKVSINNKYGDVNITTWNENRVVIEIKITINGDDLDAVESKLNSINVKFNSSSSLVEAKTIFEKQKSSWTSWWKKSNTINYKINYFVKMPTSNAVNLNNDYGSIYLDNLTGTADINCDYGNISIGQLLADNNTINLNYCSSSTVSYIKNGNITLDYSKIIVEQAKNIKVNADYSTLKFKKVDTIDFNLDYGSISIEDAENIVGNSDYVGMKFGVIRKNLKINTDYGSLNIERVTKGFETINIDGQYTGIRINVDSDVIFNFVLDLQYASFKRNDDKMEFHKSITKSTKKYYEGKFGKGNSNATIKIKSQYGGVSIKEN